jgi:hypothetical protein
VFIRRVHKMCYIHGQSYKHLLFYVLFLSQVINFRRLRMCAKIKFILAVQFGRFSHFNCSFSRWSCSSLLIQFTAEVHIRAKRLFDLKRLCWECSVFLLISYWHLASFYEHCRKWRIKILPWASSLTGCSRERNLWLNTGSEFEIHTAFLPLDRLHCV